MKRLVAVALAGLVSACSKGYSRSPTLGISVDATTLDNDGSHATITALTIDTAGKPGTGSVTFAARFGDMNGTGGPSAPATADGTGTAIATYACNVAVEPRCTQGTVPITMTWSGVSNTISLTIKDANPDAGTGSTPDAGPVVNSSKLTSAGVYPLFVTVASAANPAQNLPGSATFTFIVSSSAGVPLSGIAVDFAEQQGENRLTLSATSATSDSSGKVTVVATSLNSVGLAHVIASLANGTSVTVPLPVLGAPTAIVWKSATPSVLGLKGSGIQETGLMTFTITDALGSPVPGAEVDFTQNQPALVSFANSSATTDAQGLAAVSYSAGPEVGVSSIVATVAATGATTSRSVAVRGARPSASGFYFACNVANLPVYTTTARIETTTCTVRLSDRFGNRVGIPTPVNFAAEAGAISASVVTKAFDFNNPSDPNEGTATVTFSTDMGNGTSPADVDPLPADAAQYPWPRDYPEPQVQQGQLVVNPRDQLVTIIAMTEGEEAFVDGNHNGILDNDEVFVDLGDPFIDANDDGQYDQIYPGGPWEVRFCGQTGADCSTYHGPNGQWDSLTTIWVPTWVVFSGVVAPHTAAAGQPPPTPNDYSPSCVEHSSQGFSSIYVYDAWLNSPSAGATYGAPAIETGAVTTKKHGFGAQLDQWGAMGILGLDFDYHLVSTSGGLCAAPASPTAPTPCVQKLLFRDFDTGFRGTVEADLGASVATSGTCATPNPFQTSIQVNGAHGTYAVGYQNGTSAP